MVWGRRPPRASLDFAEEMNVSGRTRIQLHPLGEILNVWLSAHMACNYVFCTDLRTNSDYLPIQHQRTGFYNGDSVFTARYGLGL